MKKLIYPTLFLFIIIPIQAFSQDHYFPGFGNKWEHREPAKIGFNEKKLNDAVQFAQDNEYKGSKDLRIAILEAYSDEPDYHIVGPTKERGGQAGMIIKNGYIVKEWGDINRVDMTFSVTKSFLATVAGYAYDQNLIVPGSKLNDYVWDGTFNGEHNSKITWHHLLNQSSDWSGQLFGIYDWADRPPSTGGIDDWSNRKLIEPGTFFEYNDVRVNLLAYSLLQVLRKPLPSVLKEHIMDPIDASTTWRWYGYANSWVEIDGLKIQSVSGGGHFGGGLFINTMDMARFGLMFMYGGVWNGKQVISKEWITKMRQPSEANEGYGYLWWLNKGPEKWAGISEDVYYAAGFGGNYIVIDEENELLIVTRWLEPSKIGEFVKLINDSLQ